MPAELLDLKVCDPAVGSGAILVAACRYLAKRLVEAWILAGMAEAEGDPDEVCSSRACRAVADRCVYGVDRDPMAVEMAKLSLWLVTLSKERPFSFLDHALKAGDSLLGITDLEQLRSLAHGSSDRPSPPARDSARILPLWTPPWSVQSACAANWKLSR